MPVKIKTHPEITFHIDIMDTDDSELITYWQKELGKYLQAGIQGLELMGELLLRHDELKRAEAGNEDFVMVLLIHWIFQRLRNSLKLLLAGYFPDAVGTLRQAHEGFLRQRMNLSSDHAAKWLIGREEKLTDSAISEGLEFKTRFLEGLGLLAELYHPNYKAVSIQIGLEPAIEVDLAGSKDKEVGHKLFHKWLETLGRELFFLSNKYERLWSKAPEFACRMKNLDRLAQEHDNFLRESFPDINSPKAA